MGGQKKYLPWGDANILNSYRNQGINVDKITSISNEELTNIRTDDGVPKTDYYHEESKRVNLWKPLLSMIASCIPGLNLAYGALNGLLGKDLITGQKLSGGNRLLSFFGSGGFGELSKLTGAANLGKVTNSLNSLNKTFGSLNKLATFTNNINKLSIAVFANDLTDGSGQKIQGASRFVAGLSQFGDAGDSLARIYKLGAGITGNQNIFGGKELSDEQRFNLVAGTIAPYLGQAIGNIPKEGLGAFKQEAERFISDVGTGLNLIAKSPIYAYNYVANAYESNARYKNYLNGEVDINKLNGKELIDLMKRIQTDNDKANDFKLSELSRETAERFSNNEISNRLVQLERLDKITGLTDAQKQMVEALKGERGIRITQHEGNIKAILELTITGTQVAGPGAGTPKYDFTKLTEAQWQQLINSFGNLDQLGYSIPQVGVSTTGFAGLKIICNDLVNREMEALKQAGMEVTGPILADKVEKGLMDILKIPKGVAKGLVGTIELMIGPSVLRGKHRDTSPI